MVDQRQDDNARDRITQLTISTERLVLISENQSKAIQAHEDWINAHDDKYHHLDLEMKETKMIVANWSTQISEVKDQMKSLVQSINKINDVGLKVKGGWVTTVVFASIFMGLVSLAKSFGVI